MRSYDIGNRLVFEMVATDPETRAVVDPTSVALRLRDPLGVEIPVTVQRTATGTYSAAYTPITPGLWKVRWTCAGAVVAASEYSFEMRPSAFVN